jgi:hypothetical protein
MSQFALVRQGDIRITDPTKQANNYAWDKRYQNVIIHEHSARLSNTDLPYVVRTYQWRNEKGKQAALKVLLFFVSEELTTDLDAENDVGCRFHG